MTPAAGQKPGLPCTGWLRMRGGYAPKDPIWRATRGWVGGGQDTTALCSVSIKKTRHAEAVLLLSLGTTVLIKVVPIAPYLLLPPG